MAVPLQQQWYDFYTWYFGASVGSDGYAHTGGNNANIDYFTDTPSVDDTFEFKIPEPIAGIKFEVGTPMNGNPNIVWEYYTYNATWKTLRVENGDAILYPGTQIVRFTPPADWGAWGSNSRPGYKIRMRLTDVTGVSEGGANATNKIQKLYYSFDVTGTNQKMNNVYSHDITTAYTLLSAVTPAASLSPIECPFKKSGITGKLDVILNGCTVGAGDTVVLTGTDFDGSTLTETIDVSGGGSTTYTTTNCFQDVTDVACNGFNDGTIQLDTKRIGLCQRRGTSLGYNFDLYANVIFGDNSTTTTVTAYREDWNFLYIATKYCVYGSTTTLTFGDYESSGDVEHGYYGMNISFVDLPG